MLIRKLAEYTMQGRSQAVIAALVFTFLPFLSWMGIVIAALVTLRKGGKEGFIVLGWIALPSIVLAILGDPSLLIYDVILGSVLVWLLALALRRTASWKYVIQCATLLGVIIVMVIHGYSSDLEQFWLMRLSGYLQQFNNQFNLSIESKDIQNWAEWVAKIATGTQIVVVMIGNLLNLGIARLMQAMLYNPRALRPELYTIRVDVLMLFLLASALLLALSGMNLAVDLIPVLLMPFVLSGLSLVHCLLNRAKTSWTWLLIFYGLFVLFFPYVIGLLVLAAIIDKWWDFRSWIRVAHH